MVNSGSFDSTDGNRNGKTRCTQDGEAALGSQSSSDADDDACKSGALKSADGDLPSEESAIEPTPTKTTEINGPQQQRASTKAALPVVVPDAVEDGVKQTRKLLCLYCDRTFVSANLRQKHVERVHSVKSTRRVSARRQNPLSTTPCSHCDKLNANEHTLNDLFQHLVQEHSAKYFGCLFCKERFKSSTNLADHNIAQHYTEARGLLKEPDSIPRGNEVSTKLTRSKVRNKPEEPLDVEENCGVSKRKKNAKLKKIAVKTSKIALKRSKRLQQQASEHEAQKKRRDRKTNYESTSTGKSLEKSNKALCVNPYPEFDSYFRVKKITDHSIDNLKISSLTFDDVFDKAFFNRIKCNIEENLLNHIDGKLFKNEESESRISNFEKISSLTQEVPNSSNDNYGCDISLNAITPAPSLLLNSQFGEDFESQIEYGAKPSKKRPQVKSDEVHYKYFTRRKYQASILQQKENRDLSKLDMWTQMVVKERQEKVINKKKNAKEIQEYVTGQEYLSKVKRDELNKILDRRGPFEDLKEEASKKAAFDKLNSSSGSDVSQEVFTDVRELLNDLLNRVYEAINIDDGGADDSSKEVDHRQIPEHLNLRRKTSSTQEEIDKSDKIALICSSQETENFELPTNTVRAKNELVELTGEWARSRMYICAACGGKFSNMKYLLEHKSLYHPNVWVQHYEFVGNQGQLYRHLSIPGLGMMGIVEETVPLKQWKRSDARACTKCGKRCNTLGELHRHVLECGGDWTWMLARKKCKYRPFGAKSRRKRRGFEPRIQNKRKTEPSEKKTYKKPVEGPRQRPSDADTIQRMLANLPAKRSRRCIMSLSDVVFKSRKAEKRTAKKSIPVSKGRKTVRKKQSDSGKTNSNQQRTSRALRSFNKVLSSRILDLSSSLMVKRKLKVLRSQRLTRNLVQAKEEDSEEFPLEDTDDEEVQKRRKPAKKDLEVTSEAKAPVEIKKKPTNTPKRMLATRLNLKNFFTVKKKNIRAGQKKSDLDESVLKAKQLDSFEQLKKHKKGGLKGFVRALSLRKKTSKDQEEAEANMEVSKNTWRFKAKPDQSPPELKDEDSNVPPSSPEQPSKKRKLQRSFRSVLNKVKKLKTEKAVAKKEGQPFLEKAPLQEIAEQVRVVTPAKVKDESQGLEDFAPTAAKENPAIPETFFNLENNEEKSLQAKGNENFDVKLEESDPKPESTALSLDTNVKSKCVPMISPSPKGKIRKPSRGLNDCIAMLTSKLHQKDDKMSSSLESLFSTSSVTSTEPRPESRSLADNFPIPATVSKPKALSPAVEETALDLSKKSCSTPNLTYIAEPILEYPTPLAGTARTSVDDIIQQVVLDCNNFPGLIARNKLDDTIESVVHSSLDWFEDKQHKKLRRKKHHDTLITNIIFGKDKLIIAPSSDLENPLIATIKQNEYLLAKMSSEAGIDKDETEKDVDGAPQTETLQHVDEVIQHVATAADTETLKDSKSNQKRQKRNKCSPPAVLETHLDDQLTIQEIPDEHIERAAMKPTEQKSELCAANEPTILENKVISQTSSDSEDEIPLAVIAKLDESQQTVGAGQKVDESSKAQESNRLICSSDFLSDAKDVEALTTDSLKENIEEVDNNTSNENVTNEKAKRKRRKKVFNNKKRPNRKAASAKPKAFTSLTVEPATTEQILSSEVAEEFAAKTPHPENAVKLSQRTRRKSKSSKKVDKIENDLFKNFSLVINKKTKRIPPTSIVDDSVCDDLLDSDFFAKPKDSKVEDSGSEALLNDSVEEMDMEIEDIPISSNIIERNKEQIADSMSFEPSSVLVEDNLRQFGTEMPCSELVEEETFTSGAVEAPHFPEEANLQVINNSPEDVEAGLEDNLNQNVEDVALAEPIPTSLVQCNNRKKLKRSKTRKMPDYPPDKSEGRRTRRSLSGSSLELISPIDEPLAALKFEGKSDSALPNQNTPISNLNHQPDEDGGSITEMKSTLPGASLLATKQTLEAKPGSAGFSAVDSSLRAALDEKDENIPVELEDVVRPSSQTSRSSLNLEVKMDEVHNHDIPLGNNGNVLDMMKIADLNRIEKLMEDSDFVDRLIESKKALTSDDTDHWMNIQTTFQHQTMSEGFEETEEPDRSGRVPEDTFQPLSESHVLAEIINTKEKTGRRGKQLEKFPPGDKSGETVAPEQTWESDAEFSGTSSTNLDESLKFEVDKLKENLQESEKNKTLAVESLGAPYCEETSTKCRRSRKVINYNEDSLEKRAMETLLSLDVKKSPTKKNKKGRKSVETLDSLENEVPNGNGLKSSNEPLLEPSWKSGDGARKTAEDEVEEGIRKIPEITPIVFKAVEFLEIPKLVVDIHHFDQIDHKLAFSTSNRRSSEAEINEEKIGSNPETSTSNNHEIDTFLHESDQKNHSTTTPGEMASKLFEAPSVTKNTVSDYEFETTTCTSLQNNDIRTSQNRSELNSKANSDPCDSSSVEYEINSAPSGTTENSPLLIKFNRRCRKNVNYNEDALLNNIEYSSKAHKRKSRNKSSIPSDDLPLQEGTKNAEASIPKVDDEASPREEIEAVEDSTLEAHSRKSAVASDCLVLPETVKSPEVSNARTQNGSLVVSENIYLQQDSSEFEDAVQESFKNAEDALPAPDPQFAPVTKDVFDFEESGDDFEINQNNLLRKPLGKLYKDVVEDVMVAEEFPQKKTSRARRGERALKKVKKNNMDIDVANILASDRRTPRKSKTSSKRNEETELSPKDGFDANSYHFSESPPGVNRGNDFQSSSTSNDDITATAEKSSDNTEKLDYTLFVGIAEPMEDAILEEKALTTDERQQEQKKPSDDPVAEETERQVQLAEINIKNLLLSSLAAPDSPYQLESTPVKAKPKKKVKKSKHSKSQLSSGAGRSKKKALLDKNLSMTELKNVLSTFTNNSHTSNEMMPLSEIISSSEMDIAPVLDEIDKSLECDDIYDFIEDDLNKRNLSKVRPRRTEVDRKVIKAPECEELLSGCSEIQNTDFKNCAKNLEVTHRSNKLLEEQVGNILNTPMEQYETNLLSELKIINSSLTSMSKELPHTNDTIDELNRAAGEAIEGLELRRSRRGSRKVASYNENDLIDPIIDALERRRSRSARKDKPPVKSDAVVQDKPKLTSEELFDLLKKSSVENESAIAPKPNNCFIEDLNENSSNGAFQGISDEDDEDEYSMPSVATTNGVQNADKIYEFTEDSPENTENIKDLLGKSKKKPNPIAETPQVDALQGMLEKPNYCEICKKSFIRMENLVKHKMTLTHISKLSEIEAKEAEEKAKLEKQVDMREEINISDILQPSERAQVSFQAESPSLRSTHSLKLVDIISDVLNKPAMESYSADKQFSKDSMDIRKYKSLGERKSFESDSLFTTNQYVPPTLSQTIILENQINLLENIIGNNLEHIATSKTSNFVEELSSCSNGSHLEHVNHQNAPINSDSTDFVKPTQYEEISEDSTNAKVFEQRKTLNRDEELFLECCSLLKSGSEVSNSNYTKRMEKQIEQDERAVLEDNKLMQTAEEAHEYSANSRTPTPLGDTYDDDASNSNTISSNWHLNSEKPLDKNRSFSFGEVKSKEASGMTFGEMLTKGLRNQFEGFTKDFDRSNDSFPEVPEHNLSPSDERREDSDSSSASKKVATKGARKVFEGLKVSIPTEDLNLDLLNTHKRCEENSSPPAEEKVEQQSPSKPRSTRKSKPVKKSEVGSKLLFKVNKTKCPTVPKEKDQLRNFDESLDRANGSEDTNDFPKPPSERGAKDDSILSSDNESLGYADSIGADVKSITSVSSVSTKQPEVAPENITKKKYKIMGKIFRNAAKSKMDDIDEELRNIPEIPEMDNLELVENYVRSCQRVQSPYLPLPPPTPLEEISQKPKMSEEEMNMLFDQLVGKQTNETKPEKAIKPAKSKPSEPKKRNGKMKSRKRGRGNSESSDDEFNISRTTKKRSSKKNNQEDSGINLELELKECIGVASRKSQRTCTSGKQNILLEYWSSDEEAFEAMLESHKIPIPNQEEKQKAPEAAKVPRKSPTKKKALQTKKSKPPSSNDSTTGTTTASNRRKRAAANPLYHWSSSSEDESQGLIEVKPIREEYDEDDRPVQHGWIVGDSPKKLVTMLALTKGKKTDFDSVKEQGRKRASNSNS